MGRLSPADWSSLREDGPGLLFITFLGLCAYVASRDIAISGFLWALMLTCYYANTAAELRHELRRRKMLD